MEERQAKKIKLEWSAEMIKVLVDKLNDDKETYYMTLTNYTCLIETEDYDYHFLKNMQRPIVFSIASEIKRHMDTAIIKENIKAVDRDSMKYYSARQLEKSFYKHKAYNIDINAAYPTCLFNNKLIDEKLYIKLMLLMKDERLASIGMMASRKRRFSIVEGEVKDYEDTESDYSKYFFYCVKTIANLIWECEIVSGTSFLYSWVDGLYVTDRSSAEMCRRLLSNAGYKSTVSEITDFQYTPSYNKIKITFTKDGENKLFNIPIENNRLAQILKYIHHETAND